MTSNGMAVAAKIRNSHRRRGGILDAGFSGATFFSFLERAFFGKCFFGFKWVHSN
jgi:hypothetical protein